LSCPFGAQGTVRAEPTLDVEDPWIRTAAKRIVEAGGADMYPEATRRLTSSPK